MRPSGQMMIETQFYRAEDFSEGLAAVALGGKPNERNRILIDGTKWGFIDAKGKMVIPPQFDEIVFPFSPGRAVVWNSGTGKVGLIDKTGKLVVAYEFEH